MSVIAVWNLSFCMENFDRLKMVWLRLSHFVWWVPADRSTNVVLDSPYGSSSDRTAHGAGVEIDRDGVLRLASLDVYAHPGLTGSVL